MSRSEEISIGFKQEGPLTEDDYIALAMSVSGLVDSLDLHTQWLQRFAEKRGVGRGDYIRYEIGRIAAGSRIERTPNE